MTAAKAIEILDKHGLVDDETTWEDYLKAAQLGKEALEAIKCGREGLRTEFFTLLPSETEE